MEVKKYIDALISGQMVAGPTETVFGFFADVTNDSGIEAIYKAKGRNQLQPLQVLVSNATMAKELVEWNEKAERLTQDFWPGGLTIILPKKIGAVVSLKLNTLNNTIGVRCPNHNFPQSLLTALGQPLAASSANKSGQATLQNIEQIAALFPHILVAPQTEELQNIASTVIDLCDENYPKILREGTVSRKEIEAILKIETY